MAARFMWGLDRNTMTMTGRDTVVAAAIVSPDVVSFEWHSRSPHMKRAGIRDGARPQRFARDLCRQCQRALELRWSGPLLGEHHNAIPTSIGHRHPANVTLSGRPTVSW